MSESFKDKCGLFGVWDVEEAAHITYLGLFAQQHRGQEGAGIISSRHGRFTGVRDEGLVSKVFNPENLKPLLGSRAIGHVRYGTAGGSDPRNVQPIWAESSTGDIAIAHNGTLTNGQTLRKKLEAEGSVFQSYVDTEVIVHLMARAKGSHAERFMEALSQIEGAYSLLCLARDGDRTRLFAARDPSGFRPLVLGRLGEGYVVASETCAFDLVGATYEREIDPGEVVELSREGLNTWCMAEKRKPSPCVFEWIYFARPDSIVFGESIYQTRKKLGEILADYDKADDVKADMVIGVPDSGIPAAIGYSHASGLPFEMGLIRNHYIGRTFIQPHQSIRDFGVKIKQNPLPLNLKGKSIIVVDDSIVRGTTSKKIIGFLKAAGAKAVHMRIAAPPTKSPCYYGIDTPEKDQLIAANKTVAEICEYTGADSLKYIKIEDLYTRMERKSPMCDACFTENYPVEPTDLKPQTTC